MDSSQRLENLAADFDILKDKVAEKMRSPNANIDRLIAEGDMMLRSMQMELQKAPTVERRNLQRIHDTRLREWEALKRSLVLGSGPVVSPAPVGSDQRLMQGQRILQDTNQSVFRAAQIAQENEAIGTEVMTELGIQREVLVRTRDRLTDANEDLTRTNQILRSMNRRILTNKCLLVFIILLEVAILSAVVYVRFIHKKKV